MNNQRGWTITELLMAIAALATIGVWIGLAYVAIHFIAKFW